MFAPFDQESAFLICKKLCSELDSGVSKLVRVSKLSAEREGQGVMLGAVKCTDSDGSEVYAYTVSGSAYVLDRGGITDMVFVPPIVSPKNIAAALSENDAQIHSLTECINEAKKKRPPLFTDVTAAHFTDFCFFKKSKRPLPLSLRRQKNTHA